MMTAPKDVVNRFSKDELRRARKEVRKKTGWQPLVHRESKIPEKKEQEMKTSLFSAEFFQELGLSEKRAKEVLGFLEAGEWVGDWLLDKDRNRVAEAVKYSKGYEMDGSEEEKANIKISVRYSDLISRAIKETAHSDRGKLPGPEDELETVMQNFSELTRVTDTAMTYAFAVTGKELSTIEKSEKKAEALFIQNDFQEKIKKRLKNATRVGIFEHGWTGGKELAHAIGKQAAEQVDIAGKYLKWAKDAGEEDVYHLSYDSFGMGNNDFTKKVSWHRGTLDGFGPDDGADHSVALWSTLGICPEGKSRVVDVIGHSMGGAKVLYIAADYADYLPPGARLNVLSYNPSILEPDGANPNRWTDYQNEDSILNTITAFFVTGGIVPVDKMGKRFFPGDSYGLLKKKIVDFLISNNYLPYESMKDVTNYHGKRFNEWTLNAVLSAAGNLQQRGISAKDWHRVLWQRNVNLNIVTNSGDKMVNPKETVACLPEVNDEVFAASEQKGGHKPPPVIVLGSYRKRVNGRQEVPGTHYSFMQRDRENTTHEMLDMMEATFDLKRSEQGWLKYWAYKAKREGDLSTALSLEVGAKEVSGERTARLFSKLAEREKSAADLMARNFPPYSGRDIAGFIEWRLANGEEKAVKEEVKRYLEDIFSAYEPILEEPEKKADKARAIEKLQRAVRAQYGEDSGLVEVMTDMAEGKEVLEGNSLLALEKIFQFIEKYQENFEYNMG